ncbi:unnamed protein product (macronuclear) [Paramecium tetraurelia]|uniref:Pirin N-terminal domain-containing protein n=1 Tax=Paramecium tetraurelia TaxID=5888 RepID=A0E7M4_PARTE|nr:uncharacterized protein GSPATT00024019001 [Paramecium tetraurelia]CAK91291.1 unnamed protein product [Paramecium tetraurelia]|eukprot:XP_001458688.1 hypothetical protein (macronuclear) [Paramecium tetraurelia strain d4-2]
MLQNFIQEFVHTQFTLRPQLYQRCGFEARYLFNFGEYCDPRHQLPISIVIWRLPPAEQLKQATHPQNDIITYILKGQYRQDNSISENQSFKEGDAVQYICGNDNSYHRDSNNSQDVSEILQIFIQNIDVQRDTCQQLYKHNQIIRNEKYYEMCILQGESLIDNTNFTFLIVLNLDEALLSIDDKLNLRKYECQYFNTLTKIKISGNKYIVIKLL